MSKISRTRIRLHRNVSSRFLKYTRDILVWLPPSYQSTSRKRYPVLYIQDGQNLMDPATAFLGRDWQLHCTVEQGIRTGQIQEIIIVGIYNTPARNEEYTGGRQGQQYARFVVEELKPWIDAHYRTCVDSSQTAVMGSSLGALISFYFAWWYPEIFSAAACLSGSFFWNRGAAMREVHHYSGPKKPIRIYLDVGSKERALIPGFREMTNLLKEQGYQEGSDLLSYFAQGGEHNEISWGKRVWRPLTFLFPGKNYSANHERTQIIFDTISGKRS